jgi:hypothetical protein
LRNTKKAAGLLELPDRVTKLQQGATVWAVVGDDSPAGGAPAATHAQEAGI